jgi:hypothetical protein
VGPSRRTEQAQGIRASDRQGIFRSTEGRVPRSNLRNLMLDFETVDAVERGVFHIYAVETIDQGIEILTGVRAGTIDEPGTINFLVAKRLREMGEKMREHPLPETRVIHEDAPATPPPPKPPAPPEPPR